LFYKSLDGVLLRCLGPEEAKKMMSEVHDGMCGAHQSAYRMMGYQASRVLLADDIRGLL
jgi:hypothetical protein